MKLTINSVCFTHQKNIKKTIHHFEGTSRAVNKHWLSYTPVHDRKNDSPTVVTSILAQREAVTAYGRSSCASDNVILIGFIEDA